MGLLDSILGAVAGSQQAQAGSGGGMGGLGSLGGLLTMVTSNPQVLQAVVGMLGNDGAHGGLGGLVQKFQQAGLGDVVGSWIGTGQNQPISGSQLSDVLGSDTITHLAEKLGVNPSVAADQLSSVLPGLIDQLTPQGQAPEGGLGNSGDLMGVLGRLLR
ncbi:MAG: DUF937 domain-containing protein [Polaromonas sp.]|nr:MAG: DUF937 domain-containing protein [Polaromonas sp.]